MGNVIYSQKHDAYYIAETGEWLEAKCDDPNCAYCCNRPEKAELNDTKEPA